MGDVKKSALMDVKHVPAEEQANVTWSKVQVVRSALLQPTRVNMVNILLELGARWNAGTRARC